MKRLITIALVLFLTAWQLPTPAQEKVTETHTLYDANGNPYRVEYYYEIYGGYHSSTGVTLDARKYSGVKDTRTGIVTSDFSDDVAEDVERIMRQYHSVLTDANCEGLASIEYNCSAYACGITDCWLCPKGVSALIDAGDLAPASDMRNATVAIHQYGKSLDHASRLLVEVIVPPSCSGTKAPAKADFLLFSCLGKFGAAGIYKTSIHDAESTMGADHTYYYTINRPLK